VLKLDGNLRAGLQHVGRISRKLPPIEFETNRSSVGARKPCGLTAKNGVQLGAAVSLTGNLRSTAKARCDLMGVAPYSEADGMLVRRFLTPAHDEALKTLAFWMEEAGMSARRGVLRQKIFESSQPLQHQPNRQAWASKPVARTVDSKRDARTKIELLCW
jgi:hypothetical protein